MKKTFNVKVNDKSYCVEVEETSCACISPRELPSELAARIAHISAKKDTSGSLCVNAPLPGLIVEVLVKEGQNVKSGDKLLVLEAMKMENSILAPITGVIEKILVKEGESVNGKHTMIQLKH
ncbi:MAG TPA: acetyl-CoA carboxylase biotin carboxyl carrier protein subunit [Lentisphaeria bacterium]|nr:MAG: hypothetical protein A2X47_00560 [Lentisphaerae bacterium GWF2_38_69]HBM16863.1 acetyl-CoA carboxylase biotin carboxyl carrier protein subunit [Lentisphaeria bacterium]